MKNFFFFFYRYLFVFCRTRFVVRHCSQLHQKLRSWSNQHLKNKYLKYITDEHRLKKYQKIIKKIRKKLYQKKKKKKVTQTIDIIADLESITEAHAAKLFLRFP